MAEEYIKREDVINRVRNCSKDCASCDFAEQGDSWCAGEVWGVDILRIQPADVRPVVLCRDCEHRERSLDNPNRTYFCCHENSRSVMLDDYCSFACKAEDKER